MTSFQRGTATERPARVDALGRLEEVLLGLGTSGQDVVNNLRIANSATNTASASGSDSLALGIRALSDGATSIAIGRDTASSGSDSCAMMRGAVVAAGALAGLALGLASAVTGSESMAIGRLASSAGTYAVAVGRSAKADGGNSLAIGRFATGSGTDSIAIGRSAVASTTGAVQLGLGTNAVVNSLNLLRWQLHDGTSTANDLFMVKRAGAFVALSPPAIAIPTNANAAAAGVPVGGFYTSTTDPAIVYRRLV